jgi:hypothetical protein
MASFFRSFSNLVSDLSVIALARYFPGWFIKENPKLSAVRAADQLLLTFEFVNMSIHKASESDPEAYAIPGQDAYLIVHFQPQNIVEQAFFETDPNLGFKSVKGEEDPSAKKPFPGDKFPTPPVPVLSRMAKPSRLVFKVPADEAPISLDLEALLKKCSEYELSVAPTALPPEPKVRWYLLDPVVLQQRFDLVSPLELTAKNLTAARLSQFERSFPLESEQERLMQAAESAIFIPLSPAQKVILSARQQYFASNSSLEKYIEAEADTAISAGNLATIVAKLPPRLRAPQSTETSIEAPFRLILSPNKYGAWFHSTEPVESEDGQVVELWHTRLGTRTSDEHTEDDHFLRTVRAIWTRDWIGSLEANKDDWGHPPTPSEIPFLMPLDASDRHNLVHLSANFRIWYQKLNKNYKEQYTPEPVHVDQMMLSSLGAWLDLRGSWNPPVDNSGDKLGGLSVTEWKQRGTLGRDHYVKVVYKGYLAPFGHKAVLVKITERRFHPDMPGNIAFMRQRMFIVVRQPERVFGYTGLRTPAPDLKSYDLQMPFTSVRITTLVTPNIDKPSDSDVMHPMPLFLPDIPYDRNMFWPRVNGVEFPFHVVAEDLEQRKVEFDAPMLFVSTDGAVATEQDNMLDARVEMDTHPALCTYDLKGQSMAFANIQNPGDTSFETHSLTFSILVPDEGKPPEVDTQYRVLANAFNDDDILRAFPRMVQAEVVIPSIKHMVGNNSPAKIKYPDKFLTAGFDKTGNNGQIFAELVNAVGLSFNGQGDRSGALVQPNMSIKGLSRSIGLVGGSDDPSNTSHDKVMGGEFDPTQFFKEMSPMIFGVINLMDVVNKIGPGLDGGLLDKVPRFITEAMKAVDSLMNDLDTLQTIVNDAQVKAAVGVNLVNDLLQDYTNLTNDLDKFVKGAGDLTVTEGHFATFAGHINTLAPLIPAMPTNVPTEMKQRLDTLVKQFQTAVADVQYIEKLIKSLQIPSELKIRFEWSPDLHNWNDIFIAENQWTSKKASLLIAVELQAKTNLRPDPSFNAICSLQNFTLDLIGNFVSFLKLHFERVEFTASSSKKPDINVVISEIEFVGVLSFVQALKQVIPLDGFSDPPAIEVSAEGIKGGFSLALPNLPFGVFSLTNLSLGAGFSIPFIGKPLSVRFNFCERESPFHLTVSMFGGGGFFAITVDPSDVQILEAAFEFGAELSIDFGVASGGVSVMAGIYYRMESGDASLTGYFRLHGEVSVLGIISASIELYLELRYEFSSGKCVGKACLTIEVSVFMFSISVTITCERKFAGSNGDPSFAQLMEPYIDPVSNVLVEPWSEYCAAFA